jgi:flagellar biosynthesis protein
VSVPEDEWHPLEDMTKSSTYFQAFALGFPDGEDAPPALTARGEYGLADEIVRIARRFGVPVVEREEIAESLAPLELDQPIPPELFEVAAALLVEVGAMHGLGVTAKNS